MSISFTSTCKITGEKTFWHLEKSCHNRAMITRRAGQFVDCVSAMENLPNHDPEDPFGPFSPFPAWYDFTIARMDATREFSKAEWVELNTLKETSELYS
jgi:hypothetical protein